VDLYVHAWVCNMYVCVGFLMFVYRIVLTIM